MAKDINKQPFPVETRLKLQIFSECFREWFPVFIHNHYIHEVFIYDFFAGSGKDSVGTLGSPLVLLNEAKGDGCKYCNQVEKKIYFAFNEKDKVKQSSLVENIKDFMSNCLSQNCKRNKCVYDYLIFSQMDFKDAFQDSKFQAILNNINFGKFILLDQCGFSQIEIDTFHKLVHAPKTDFIFFISSSYIRRFKDEPAVKRYFDTAKIAFDEKRPKDCHRLIAEYYKSFVPPGREYYLHHFTIQKGANYWGLIFGTNHSLGMEKFLKVCWRYDKMAGESNCNVYGDFLQDTLFYNENETVKKMKLETEIKNKIISGEISDNITGLKYALKQGCLPALFTLTVKKLEAEQRILRTGDLNYTSTNIHKAKQYRITVI